MKAGLGVVKVTADPAANLARLVAMTREAAAGGAELVLFPEAVLTGLTNNDDPAHDLPLGESVPGPTTAQIAAVAKRHGLWVAFGLLERAGDCLYDTAALISPQGEIALAYRRINPQWHGRHAPAHIYGQGEEVRAVPTPWGRMAFLICGDLFDDAVVAQTRELAPDWLLFPFARCFSGGEIDQARWDGEELPAYAERVRQVGAPALMVNYLADARSLPEDGSFGGAGVVSALGEPVAQIPLGQEGLWLVDLP